MWLHACCRLKLHETRNSESKVTPCSTSLLTRGRLALLPAGGQVARQLARLAEDVAELRHESSGLRSEVLIAAGQQMFAGMTGAKLRIGVFCTSVPSVPSTMGSILRYSRPEYFSSSC